MSGLGWLLSFNSKRALTVVAGSSECARYSCRSALLFKAIIESRNQQTLELTDTCEEDSSEAKDRRWMQC